MTLPKALSLLLLLLFLHPSLPALDNGEGKKSTEYRDEALELIREKAYPEALKLLDEAVNRFPDDEELVGLHQSVMDLMALENPVFGEDPPPPRDESSWDRQQKPDFAVTARDDAKTGSGEKGRNTIAVDLSAKTMTNLGSLEDPLTFLSSLGTSFGAAADFRYYVPLFRRLIGLGIWYEGYMGGFDGVELLPAFFHQGGFNLLLRSFPIETSDVRSELSLELGGGITFFRNTPDQEKTIYYRLLMQLAIYAEDPLLYRLFEYESLKNLYLKGGVRFFYYFVEDSNMVRYRVGMTLKPRRKGWNTGVFFHLEDMDIADWKLSSWGIIFQVGFRF